MKTYPTLITEDSVIVLKDGKRLVAHKSHPNYAQIIQRVKDRRFAGIESAFSVKERVERVMGVEIRGGTVSYKNKPLHNVITQRILTFIKQGYPYKPMARFLNNLMQNPSQESIESLYLYLEKEKLPITDDGCFIAVKAIGKNWTDIHSGKISNRVGKEVWMPRNKVTPDCNECSGPGLHVGSSTYVRNYGNGQNCRFILVKVNPRDVVVVPNEGVYAKIRICRYKVEREIKDGNLDFTSDYAPENNQFKRDKYGRFIGSGSGRLKPLSLKRDALGRFC